jgi:hypothetical protein
VGIKYVVVETAPSTTLAWHRKNGGENVPKGKK